MRIKKTAAPFYWFQEETKKIMLIEKSLESILGCFYNLVFARGRKRSSSKLKKFVKTVYNQIAYVNMNMVKKKLGGLKFDDNTIFEQLSICAVG